MADSKSFPSFIPVPAINTSELEHLPNKNGGDPLLQTMMLCVCRDTECWKNLITILVKFLTTQPLPALCHCSGEECHQWISSLDGNSPLCLYCNQYYCDNCVACMTPPERSSSDTNTYTVISGCINCLVRIRHQQLAGDTQSENDRQSMDDDNSTKTS